MLVIKTEKGKSNLICLLLSYIITHGHGNNVFYMEALFISQGKIYFFYKLSFG